MMTARLISATAAIAAGLALFSPGGSSYAAWSDTVQLPDTTISSGKLNVEPVEISLEAAGNAVVVTASARLAVQGEALLADLALDVSGLTSPSGAEPKIELVTQPAGLVQLSSKSWRVDRTSDNTTVTARIELSVDAAKSLVRQPQVIWRLAQTGPGQGWYSEAVQEVSFRGLWPAAPPFPGMACTPMGTGQEMRVSWTWNGSSNVTWELHRVNSGGQTKTEPFVAGPDLVDGVYIADVTAQNESNEKFTYFVRASWIDANGQVQYQDSDFFGIGSCGASVGGTT